MTGHRPRGPLPVAIAAALLLAGAAQAQSRLPRELANYPAKALRFVVPSSPGGGADVLARSIGPRMAEVLGKPVVIENRSGAGSIIGYELAAQAPDVIVRKLNADIVRILRQPETNSQLENLGFDVFGTTPEQFTAFAQSDMAKWARELKAAGIKPQ